MDAALHDFIRHPNWDRANAIISSYETELSPMTLRLARSHQNSLTLDMLYKELKTIAKSQEPPPEPESLPIPTDKQVFRTEYKLPAESDLPKALKEVRNQIILNLREQQECRGVMKDLAYSKESTSIQTQEKLYEVSKRVQFLEDMNQEYYGQLDYYKNTGSVLSSPENPGELDEIKKLVSKYHANLNYISKYKNDERESVMAEIIIRKKEVEMVKEWYNG